ncbi:MAG: PqqD family protein [Calditrichaeota bacterium]|nr:MAG: PqqD family protein [Calditrichota bacterium]
MGDIRIFSSREPGIPAEELEEWKGVFPRICCEYDRLADDRIVVRLPRAKNRFLRKVLNLFSRSPWVRIKLDERGSLVWQLCDGKHTVEQISQVLENRFGAQVAPALERTALLLRSMYRYGMVELYRVRPHAAPDREKHP